MDMEHMMTRLLVEMKALQENMDVNQVKMDSNNEKFEVLRGNLVSRIDAHHAKTEANHKEIMAKLDAHHERMRASVDAWRKETTACQEATEACLEKAKGPTSVEMKSVSVHKEVPEEDAAVETGRELKKRHRGRHIAAGRSGKKGRAQGNGGCRKK
jgi:hypothetical protein